VRIDGLIVIWGQHRGRVIVSRLGLGHGLNGLDGLRSGVIGDNLRSGLRLGNRLGNGLRRRGFVVRRLRHRRLLRRRGLRVRRGGLRVRRRRRGSRLSSRRSRRGRGSRLGLLGRRRSSALLSWRVHGAVILIGNLAVGTGQVETLLASSVAVGRIRIGSASVIVALRRSLLRLGECLGSLYDSGHQASLDVPFHVAVQEPDTGVISAETHDNVAVVLYHDSITANGGLGNILVLTSEVAAIDGSSLQDLELMAVQMPRV